MADWQRPVELPPLPIPPRPLHEQHVPLTVIFNAFILMLNLSRIVILFSQEHSALGLHIHEPVHSCCPEDGREAATDRRPESRDLAAPKASVGWRLSAGAVGYESKIQCGVEVPLCPGPGAKVDLSPSLQKGSVRLLALKDQRGSFMRKVMMLSFFYVYVLGCVWVYVCAHVCVHACIGQRST